MSGPRFAIIPAKAMRDKRLSDSAKLVLANLGQYANDRNEWIYPCQKTIAKELGKARETVNRAIQELVKFGYILKRERNAENGTNSMFREYFILYDVQGCENISQGVVTPASQGVVTPTSHRTNPVRTIPEESAETSSAPAYPEPFELFWKRWKASGQSVKGDNKKKAFSHWQRLDHKSRELAYVHAPRFQSTFKEEHSKGTTLKYAERYLRDRDFDAFAEEPERAKPCDKVTILPNTPEWEAWYLHDKDLPYFQRLGQSGQQDWWELSRVLKPSKFPEQERKSA